MPASEQTVYVHFTREINGDTTESLLDTLTALANERAARVVLCLASPGGWIPKSIALYNMLRAFPFELVTHNVGEVGSAGIVPFMAGAERYSSPHASFFFHPASFSADAGAQFNARAINERLAKLEDHDARERRIVKQRSKLSVAQVRALVSANTTMNAADALAAGIVHGVRDLAIPAGARVVTAAARAKA